MIHNLSAHEEVRRRNLKALLQEDARRIAKCGTDGGLTPLRALLRVKARLTEIGLITAGLDIEGHHETAIEAAIRCRSDQISIQQLAGEIANGDYALQSHALYASVLKEFNSFVKKHEPEEANWQSRITHLMNKALLAIFLKKAA